MLRKRHVDGAEDEVVVHRAYALKLTRIGVGNQHFFKKLRI